jgi:ABC-2 type transport system permease protein
VELRERPRNPIILAMDTLPLPYPAAAPAAAIAPPTVRRMGRVNWIGFFTLFLKEIRRFVKVYTQTILAPVATALLFYLVFSLAMGGGAPRTVDGVPYFNFLAPGLIMMAMTQNAFANTSSSVMVSKVQGSIVDVLMTPISPTELAMAYTLGGVVRGLVVGLATGLAIACFLHLTVYSVGALLVFGVLASAAMAMLGMMGAIWADKFDHIAAVTNFIVTPLTFLSGTFYSVERFPPFLRGLTQWNPFFYMIDGFRYGFTGHAEASLWTGVAVLAGLNLVLWFLMQRMLVTGYKLKS